jgi:ribulose-phosphate 3-epimerase
LHLCDLVLVMTVEPGFGGQVFMQEQVQKILDLKKYIAAKDLSTLIEVDGGINDQTAHFCKDADVLVAGHFIFKNEMSKAIQILKEF